MDCSAVREMLALIRPDSGDADQPQLASALMHVNQCADCQAAFEAQQKNDRELSQAMRRVSVPVDLKARLLAQLTAATAPQSAPAIVAEPVVSPAPTPSQPAQRSWQRRQALVAACAALLALVGGWWLWDANQKPTLAVNNDLLELSHQAITAATPAFQGSFQPELPVREIRMPSAAEALKGAFSLRPRHQQREIGAIIPYEVPKLTGGRLSVILVVINLRKVDVPDLKSVGASFLQADVSYPKPNEFATRVWRSGHNLYVCYVRSKDPQGLDSLKHQSATT